MFTLFQTVVNVMFGATFVFLALDVVAWSKEFSPSSIIAQQMQFLNRSALHLDRETRGHDCFDRPMIAYIGESVRIAYVLVAKLFLGMTVFSMVCEVATLCSPISKEQGKDDSADKSQSTSTRTTILKLIRITSTLVSTAVILYTCTTSFTQPSEVEEFQVSFNNYAQRNTFHYEAQWAHGTLTFGVTLFVLSYGFLISCAALLRPYADKKSKLSEVDVPQANAENAWGSRLFIGIFFLLPILSILHSIWVSWSMLIGDVFQPSTLTKDYIFCTDSFEPFHFFKTIFMLLIDIVYFPIILVNVSYL